MVRNSIIDILIEKDDVVDLARVIINVNRYCFDSEVLKSVVKR